MAIGIPSVLRIPAFRRVWLASVASNGGTWLQAVAAGWLVWQLTDSAVVVGALALAYRAPALLFSTWGVEDVGRVTATWKQNNGEIISFSPADQKAFLTETSSAAAAILNANPQLREDYQAIQAAAKKHRR